MSCLTVRLQRVETFPGASARRVETGLMVTVTLLKRMRATAGLVCAVDVGRRRIVTSNSLRVMTRNGNYIVLKRHRK